MIVATGPLRNGLLVHAVAVSQPVQSWTVIRSHDDFNTVSDSLRTFLPGITPCPPSMIYHGDMTIIENSRNDLQNWLHTILHYPGARESPEVRNFLTLHANMIPPQFAEVAWVNFPSSQTTQFSQGDTLHQNHHHHHHHTSIATNNLDDMEMADMFQGDDEGTIEDDDDDPEDYISRYIPVNEPITREEEMDLMAFASEIEMVEDIGSLAQSLGASHLGRSLQLQAERNQTMTFVQSPLSPESQGVKLATPVQAKHKHGGEDYGGLSNVMEKAQQQTKVPGLGDSFHQKRPISAPKLDSFRLVKVIGIGSFGTLFTIERLRHGESLIT
jgi:PX domain